MTKKTDSDFETEDSRFVDAGTPRFVEMTDDEKRKVFGDLNDDSQWETD